MGAMCLVKVISAAEGDCDWPRAESTVVVAASANAARTDKITRMKRIISSTPRPDRSRGEVGQIGRGYPRNLAGPVRRGTILCMAMCVVNRQQQRAMLKTC